MDDLSPNSMLSFAERIKTDQPTALLYANVQAMRKVGEYVPTCDKAC